MLDRTPVLHRAGVARSGDAAKADPITTEVVRHALNSAANQMKRALVRTAFSPVIYEVLDFAVAIYDPQMRLLAQAPSLPMFMGTLNFCVEEADEECRRRGERLPRRHDHVQLALWHGLAPAGPRRGQSRLP